MKEEYKDFIGIYDESVPVDLCNEFVKNYEEAKKNRTIIDCSVKNEHTLTEKIHPIQRKDEAIYVAPLSSTIYPIPPVETYFDLLGECMMKYLKRYSIQFNQTPGNNPFYV